MREGRFRIEERTLTAFQWLYSPQQHRIVSRADLGSPSRYRGPGGCRTGVHGERCCVPAVLLTARCAMSPRGFEVGVLSLSLSLEPCEYLSILGFTFK